MTPKGKEFKTGDSVTVKGQGQKVFSVWSGDDMSYFVVPTGLPSSEGIYASHAELTLQK